MPHFIRLTQFICALFLLLLSQGAIAQPALWSVEKNGITSYLFGTVHVGDSAMHGLDPRIKAAIKSSQTVVVELNTEAISPLELQRKTLPFMQQKPGSTLKTSLSPVTYKQVKDYLSKRKIDIALFESYQPWSVMLTILQLEYQQAGFSEDYGIDKQIIEYATHIKKPIMELESLEQQLGLFSTLGAQNDAMIADTLKQVEDFEQYFTQMITAWKQGNYQKLNTFYKLSFDDSEYGQHAEQVMLIQRNNNWVATLTPRLAKSAHFIAVGALHLPQQHGLLTQLAERGFTVQRVK
ncbi:MULTISPECIES: TraB/GumN family protein [unclassified Pseudoalteromonas]|uniref:TraB/GumN family protein n=1 Tax=unclassified Pseudoalteromonas TaxID=194690 RepID=UPI001891CB02|nr:MULTISPECIES: TraB/GumN family protein [unclassified Pseudoalteromonas]MCG7562646.1 TraB/GumN family protein [Pseudoalteromonas sp. McH1-42]